MKDTMLRAIWIALLLCGMSCAGGHTPTTIPTDVIPTLDDLSIAHVVLSEALSEMSSQYNLKEIGICFVELPGDIRPTPSFLALHKFAVPLRPSSESTIGGIHNEVADKKTKKKGILVTIGEIRVNSDGTATSGFGWHKNDLAGRWFNVTLKKTEGGWVISDVSPFLVS